MQETYNTQPIQLEGQSGGKSYMPGPFVYRPTAREMNYMAEKKELTGNRASRRAKAHTRSKKARVMAGNCYSQLEGTLDDGKIESIGRINEIMFHNKRLQKLGAVL